MITKRILRNPYEWHTIFAWKPVLVVEELIAMKDGTYVALNGKWVFHSVNPMDGALADVEPPKKCVDGDLFYLIKPYSVLIEHYAWLRKVERQLQTNMSGTRKFVYRLMNA